MKALRGLLREEGRRFRFLKHRELDVTDSSAVARMLEGSAAEWVVNGAAYTDVDRAEQQRKISYRVNVEGVKTLAKRCAQLSIPLMHISTDYVFDGKLKRPYRETDPPSPLNHYGQTKREGEIAVFESSSKNIVVRTSRLFGKGGENFVGKMLRIAREQDTLRLVDDQYGSPTWTCHLAEALLALTEICGSGVIHSPGGVDAQPTQGLVHFANSGHCSWFGFAEEVLNKARQRGWLERVPELVPVSTVEYPLPAIRPAYSVLDCRFFSQLTGRQPPHWRSALTAYFDKCTEAPG